METIIKNRVRPTANLMVGRTFKYLGLVFAIFLSSIQSFLFSNTKTLPPSLLSLTSNIFYKNSTFFSYFFAYYYTLDIDK